MGRGGWLREVGGRTGYRSWPYSRAEIWADGTVHALGLAASLAAALALTGFLWLQPASAAERGATAVYLATLLASLGVSAAYNLWPVTPAKWVLRRFDHSAIFLLIAGTYTPFAVKLHLPGLLAGVWLVALGGAAVKLIWPGRFDRLAILAYLALGWSVVIAYDDVLAALAGPPLWLTAAGGLLYTAGVAFHVAERLKFHNAIWHGFVLAAAALHFAAVVLLLPFAAPPSV